MNLREGRFRKAFAGPVRAGGIVLLVCWAGQATAVEQGDFRGPGMEGFVKVTEYDADGDDDGVKETLIRRFKNLDGDRMFTMTTSDQLWAWSLDSYGDDNTQLGRNSVLRDSDCDGRFDERYRLDEEFHLPDCLK
jgi:hypothetical protein